MVLWFRRSIWLAVSRMQCSFRETLEKFVFALCLSCMRRALPRANLHFPSFAHAQRVQKCIGKFWHKSFSYSQGENRKGPVCLLLFFMIWQNLELLRGYLYFWNALLIIMIFQNKYCRAVIVGMYEWLSWPQWSLLQYSPPKKSTMVKLTTVKSVTVQSAKKVHYGEVDHSEVCYSTVHQRSLPQCSWLQWHPLWWNLPRWGPLQWSALQWSPLQWSPPLKSAVLCQPTALAGLQHGAEHRLWLGHQHWRAIKLCHLVAKQCTQVKL